MLFVSCLLLLGASVAQSTALPWEEFPSGQGPEAGGCHDNNTQAWEEFETSCADIKGGGGCEQLPLHGMGRMCGCSCPGLPEHSNECMDKDQFAKKHFNTTCSEIARAGEEHQNHGRLQCWMLGDMGLGHMCSCSCPGLRGPEHDQAEEDMIKALDPPFIYHIQQKHSRVISGPFKLQIFWHMLCRNEWGEPKMGFFVAPDGSIEDQSQHSSLSCSNHYQLCMDCDFEDGVRIGGLGLKDDAVETCGGPYDRCASIYGFDHGMEVKLALRAKFNNTWTRWGRNHFVYDIPDYTGDLDWVLLNGKDEHPDYPDKRWDRYTRERTLHRNELDKHGRDIYKGQRDL